MKKSQIEMFGLVILVILIALSLVIAIRFMFGNNENEIPIAVELSSQAGNLQLSLLKTEVCNGNSLEKVIQACCSNEDSCDQNACDLAESMIKESIKSIMPDQAYKVTAFSETECFSINNGCTENVKNQITIGPSRIGNARFEIFLCKD